MRTIRGPAGSFPLTIFLILVPPVVAVATTQSTPIAVTSDGRFAWVVNPDNNSVTVHEVFNDRNRRVREIRVGQEPWSLAISRDNRKVYVANMASGTLSVISTSNYRILKTLRTGAEPFGLALTHDGRKLYVTNFASNSLSVFDTRDDSHLGFIGMPRANFRPRGIAITPNGRVFVTSFLAHLVDDDRPVDQKEGADDGKEGIVAVINSSTNRVIGEIAINPLTNTGFLSNGSVLGRIPAVNPPVFDFPTGAFPNLLQGIAIRGNKAYIPNTGSSPNGPVRFNVNVQSLVSVIDTDTLEDTNLGVNLNVGVGAEPVGQRLFMTNPLYIAFRPNSDQAYIVSAATNRLVQVFIGSDGRVLPRLLGQTGLRRIEVGKNPQGIAINSQGTRAYVMNFLSRDMSVVDVNPGSSSYNQEIARISSAALPQPGSLAAIVQRGHELFNTSIGPAGTQENALPPAGRMSDFGWGACYSCHPRGLHDGVTWMFGDGPRQSISMESTFKHPQSPSALNPNGGPILPAFDQRVLNWSAVRDEVQDFELNTRGVSGGQGLITDGQAVVNLVPTANTGRAADQDAIAAYIAFGIRAPNSPFRTSRDPGIPVGRQIFAQANCVSCHGGPNWTRSRVDFAPPPTGESIVNGQLTRFLNPVGTFDPNHFNEVRPNIVTANGELGFNNPSLLSVFASAPYFHDGSAQTLDEVLENVTHRSAGTGGVDTLANSTSRRNLRKFLETIDASTPVFP